MNTKETDMRLICRLTVFALGASLALGCAEPVDEIDQVQPDYLAKTQFVGEWYYRQTMVDVSPEVVAGFIGMEAGLERVRWEITEDHLIAYRVHQAIEGLEEDRTLDGAEYRGDIIAQFSITKHFDIKRAYNSATGEESNKVGENTSDRPWYEREYFRVNWAGLSLDGPQDVDWWGIRFFASDSDYIREYEVYDPDAFLADEDYIQVTKRMTVETSFWCYLVYNDWQGCSSADVRLRHAFFLVPEMERQQHDARVYEDVQNLRNPKTGDRLKTMYLPVTRFGGGAEEGAECIQATDCRNGFGCIAGACGPCTQNDDCGPGEACVLCAQRENGECTSPFVELACTPELFEYLDRAYAPGYFSEDDDCDYATYAQESRHGFFRAENYGYDRRIGGGHDAHRSFRAAIHNIWRKSFETTTNDEGVEVLKLGDDGEPIRIPMSERRPKPVVYHLSVGFPEDLRESNLQIADDWNTAFMNAVVAGTGKSASEIGDMLEEDADDGAFFLEGDPLGHRGMYQIRVNNCSTAGINAYLERNPDMLDVAVEASGQSADRVQQGFTGGTDTHRRGLVAGGLDIQRGNVKRICAGLRNMSRRRDGVERFDWQQIGDPRINLLNWVNQVQGAGPLGYGPSSTDLQTGQIVSGNANIYGASLDRSAARAADVVQVMNDDLELNTLISGDSYLRWLESPNTVADVSEALSPETRKLLELRIADIDPAVAAAGLGEEIGPKATMADFKAMKEMATVRERSAVLRSPGREKLRALRDDPRFEGKLLPAEHLDLLGPMFGWEPGTEMPEEMRELAFDMSTDRDALKDRVNERFDFFADRNVFMADFIDDAVIGKALSMKGLPREEVYRQLREEIYRAVTLHEIGPTVGLTHNFAASFDPLNYQDEYWRIRVEFPEVVWADQRLPVYTFASIMDYHGRFHADTKGLGKYDEAAIKFAYAGHTEAFADDVPLAVTPDLGLYTYFVYGGQSLPSLLGENYENIANRVDVPIEQVVAERARGVVENTEKFIRQETSLDLGGIAREFPDYFVSREVPYAYCEHRYLFRARCKQWDIGSSHTEVVKNAIERYWNYYVFNAFRRGRDESSFIGSFFSRQGSVSDDLTYALRYWYFQQRRSRPSRIAADYLEATLLGINFINQVLGTPTPGRHCLDEETNTYQPAENLAPGADCEELMVAAGTGRDQFIRFSDEYNYQVDYIGSYYDKIEFLFYLMDDTTRFFNVSDLGDSRRFSINYWRLFRPEMVQLVRDMLFGYFGEGTNETFSSVVAPGGDVLPPLLIDPARYGLGERDTEGMARINTPVSYNLLWYSMLFSSALNTNWFDDQFDFIEYVTIIEQGSAEDRSLLEGRVKVEFVHPTTGAIYYAPQTFDGLSVSFDFLTYLNGFVDSEWRPAFEAFNSEDKTDADADRFARAEIRLGELTDMMNDMRLLRSAFAPGH